MRKLSLKKFIGSKNGKIESKNWKFKKRGRIMIYLDNAASTKPKEEVVNTMIEIMKNSYANPDAIHEFSHEIFLKIKN